MADTKKPAEEQKAPEAPSAGVNNPAAGNPDQPIAPVKKEKPTSGPTKMARVADTGLAGADSKGRVVRVLRDSYVNGAIFEAGSITHWPKGVEKLGDNLEEYHGD